MNSDVVGIIAFFACLTLYLVVSAWTEMGTSWPWNREQWNRDRKD